MQRCLRNEVNRLSEKYLHEAIPQSFERNQFNLSVAKASKLVNRKTYSGNTSDSNAVKLRVYKEDRDSCPKCGKEMAKNNIPRHENRNCPLQNYDGKRSNCPKCGKEIVEYNIRRYLKKSCPLRDTNHEEHAI